MDRESLTPCIISNRIMKRRCHDDTTIQKTYHGLWSVPLRRSLSHHLYTSIDNSADMHFTKVQLGCLHRQFFHPSTQKLFNFIKRARPEEVTTETMVILKEFSKRCDPCQRMQMARYDSECQQEAKKCDSMNAFSLASCILTAIQFCIS